MPPIVIAEDALAAQTAILDKLGQLPGPELDDLRELGSLEQTAAAMLGSIVSTVETYLKAQFNDGVPGAAAIVAGKGNVFQRLDDTSELFRDHLSIDLPVALGTEWERLQILYGTRHLHTHNNGIVDARHLQRFPDFPVPVGQRVTVSLTDVRDMIRLASRVLAETHRSGPEP